MGSIITLSVGQFEIDWGKNEFFVNHSKLFMPSDNQRVIELSQDEEDDEPAYSRPLSSVVRRLELLGYNLEHCRQLYEDLFRLSTQYEGEYVDITFDRFAKVLATVQVGRVQLTEAVDDYGLGEFTLRNILRGSKFSKFFENIEPYAIDPYVVLRLLAENERNLSEDVEWHYHDMVAGGWADEEELYEGLADSDRYLIVTEGKSDSFILEKSLVLLHPDIADFFSFIDMREHYPFTGTGNLTNFCQGLARIRIQNKVLVVFDNDTAGNAAHEKVKGLQLPPNMRITLLPRLSDFEAFATLGPSGPNTEDINGKAVAIELYLDLSHGPSPTPTVRWTSYDRKLDQYQGELVGKEDFALNFIKRRSFGDDYDLSKLRRLWGHLIKQCSAASPR